MTLGILNIIAQVIVVVFVLAGVVFILLGIHYGSELLFDNDKNHDSSRLRDDVNNSSKGISENNLFYKFFFRRK